MRRMLLVVLAAVILAGCAPKVPDEVKAIIEKAIPSGKYFDTVQMPSGSRSREGVSSNPSIK